MDRNSLEYLGQRFWEEANKDESFDLGELAIYYVPKLESALAETQAKVNKYKDWVKDLQSGMYVNCVYCGHRYGPEDKVPVSMADALKQHIENCPEHPMSKLKAELELYKKALEAIKDVDIVIRQEEWGAVKSKPTLKSVKRFAGEVLDQVKVKI